MMKRWMMGLTCGLLAATAARQGLAQVQMSWDLKNNRTILMEPVEATVQISNYSGIPLELGPGGNTRLAFDVEDQPTSTVPVTGRPLIRESLIIQSGDTQPVTVNLLDAYRIVKGQSYMLTPYLEFDGNRFFGRELSLEVQPGLVLLNRESGLRSNGTAREASLRLIHRDRVDHLFFRVDNPVTGYCLGAYDLGQVIRFFTPVLEQETDGTYHVLHQCSPEQFRHSSFEYDGTPLKPVYYTGQMGSMRLERHEDGTVSVAGGTAFVEDEDNPGLLTAPALPPAHSYRTTLGEFPLKGKKKEAR